MHKIFELKEMDDEKLLSIAEELGIKGAKKKDKEALVYEIMDKEAVTRKPSLIHRKNLRNRPGKEAGQRKIHLQTRAGSQPQRPQKRKRPSLQKQGNQTQTQRLQRRQLPGTPTKRKTAPRARRH